MGCPLDELGRKVDIVAELYRLSAGDPLLVGLYVGDLWAKGEAVSRLKPEDLAGIQPGYKSYFDRWWDDQKKLWGKDKPWLEKHVRTVRSLLAGALGPLFRDDFQALEPELESDYISDALDVLQRLIIGDNQTQGYTYSHPKLGQYFWESLTSNEQINVEERFLTWCERTFQEFIDGKRDPKKKTGVPVYVVRNYGTYLARNKQTIEKWLPLIHHQQWAQAWFTVEGAYDGYLQDVRRISEQCKVIDWQAVTTSKNASYFGQQIRCVFIETSLRSLVANVHPELMATLVRERIWTLPQAWAFIRQIPGPSYHQANAISALLPFLDNEQLPDALAAARAIHDIGGARVNILSNLAKLLPEVSEEAIDAIQTVQSEENRTKALITLAQSLPEQKLERVLLAARVIPDNAKRALVLSALAQRLPGISTEALETIQTIQDEDQRARALGILARSIPEAGKDALEIARTIPYEKVRADLLIFLIDYLPESQLAQVLKIVRAMRDEGNRSLVVMFLAKRPPKKQLRQVLKMAQKIKDDGVRTYTLSILAFYLPDVRGEALTAARMSQAKWWRLEAFNMLAQCMPEVSEEALQTTQTIGDEWDQARMLIDLARCLPEVSAEAVLKVQAIQDEWIRVRYMLKESAERLPVGKLVLLLEIIQDIKNEGVRIEILCSLAQRLPTKQLGQILAMIQDMAEWRLADILNILAQRMPIEKLEHILIKTRTIKNKQEQTKVLITLAQRLPGLCEEIVVVAQEMDDKECAEVLCTLLQHFPEMGNEVLKVALPIRDEYERVKVLNSLAQYLPEEKLGQLLVAARKIYNKNLRAILLSVLFQRLPNINDELLVAVDEALATRQTRIFEEDRTKELIALIKSAPESKLEQILEIARTTQHEGNRTDLLIALIQRLPDERLVPILEIAQTIKSEWIRIDLLIELAKHAPQDKLGQILEMIRAIQNYKEKCAIALSVMAQRLPELTEETLQAMQAIQDECKFAETFSNLAKCLPETQLEQMLKMAVAVTEKPMAQSIMLGALVKPLLKVSNQDSYRLLEDMLLEYVQRTRTYLFPCISRLLPVFLRIGQKNTSREIYQAVRDVTTWWP